MINFNIIDQVKFHSQKVLPLVYEDSLSYNEQLCKFQYTLNQVIENNNNLPEHIKNMILEYINSSAISGLLSELIAGFVLNVKFPPLGITPAKGDGTADDTNALQGCIDYANTHGGKCVYIPNGVYLSQSLTLKDNVSLSGAGRYNSRIVLKGGATLPLISGNPINCQICNLSLDGNADIQVNNVNAITLTGSNYTLSNLLITDGYELVDINSPEGFTTLQNIDFDKNTFKTCVISGNAKFKLDDINFNQISSLNGNCCLELNSNDVIATGIFSQAIAPIAIRNNGNNNTITAKIKNAVNSIENNGTGTNFNILGEKITETFTGAKTVNVGSQTEIISGAKFTSADIQTETIKGERKVNASAISETTETRTINVTNETKTITGTAIENSGSKTETIVGTKTAIAGNQTDTTIGTKTINAKKLIVNPEEPITYKTPTKLNDYLKTIPMKDAKGNEYSVLVRGTKDITSQYPSINVADYGAKIDGITDDTAAVQAAINALPDNGGEIIFPAGICRITSTLIIGNGTKTSHSTRNAVSLKGTVSSMSNTTTSGSVIKYDGSEQLPMIKYNGPFDHPTIDNITLDGNNKASIGIYGNIVFYLQLRAIFIYHTTVAGVHLTVLENTLPITLNNLHFLLEDSIIDVGGYPNAKCVILDGFNGNVSNPDTNMFSIKTVFLIYSGNGGCGLHLKFCDAGMIEGINCYRSGANTGSNSIIFDGSTLAGYPNEITIINMSASNGETMKFIGTTGNITFLNLLTGDGQAAPEHEKVRGITSDGKLFGDWKFYQTRTYFTPTVYGSTNAGTPTTYSDGAYYIKIGDIIKFVLNVSLSSKGGMTGDIRIKTLPKVADSKSVKYSVTKFSGVTGINGSSIGVMGYDGGDFLILTYASDSGRYAIPDTAITDTFNVTISGEYFTSP